MDVARPRAAAEVFMMNCMVASSCEAVSMVKCGRGGWDKLIVVGWLGVFVTGSVAECGSVVVSGMEKLEKIEVL